MEQVVNIRTMVEPLTHRYIVNLDRPITTPSDFQEELLTIRSAVEGDVVHIYINSEGGELRTAKSLLSAMHQSPAHIITEITGECASAATLIFLAGHEYRVSEDAEFMIHTCSYGSVGKENNVRQHVDFVARVTGNLIRKYYKHFLNEEELELCIEGKDFWMDCDEVMERLEKRQALFQEELPEDDGDEVEEVILKQLEGMFDVPERSFFEGWDAEKLISYICDDDFESKYPDVENNEDEDHEIKSQDFGSVTIYSTGELAIKGFTIRSFRLGVEQGDDEFLEEVASQLGVAYSKTITSLTLAKLVDEKVKQIVDELNKK